MGSVWVAPPLVQAELRNVMLGAVRRGDVSRDDAVALLEQAQISVDTRHEVDGADVLDLALGSGCSAYDCEFVWLARRLKVPLVTADRQVMAAFPDAALSPDRFTVR